MQLLRHAVIAMFAVIAVLGDDQLRGESDVVCAAGGDSGAAGAEDTAEAESMDTCLLQRRVVDRGPGPQLTGSAPATKRRLSQPTLCDPAVKQYSGYLPAGNGSEYFFWLFESRSDPANDPLVMWLSGGPGVSSMLGMLIENGPCSVNKDGLTTEVNPNSWNSKATVLWVDQPGSTGFSTSSTSVNSEDIVADMMYHFMQEFYVAFPQHRARDFFLFGESYAGHYIPAISHHFLTQQQAGNFAVPLRGIGIGNGWTVPQVQYQWYARMAHTGGHPEGGSMKSGVISDTATIDAMELAVGPCVREIDLCNGPASTAQLDACYNAIYLCSKVTIPFYKTGYNTYDMRIKCEIPGLCYNTSAIDIFLNAPSTQAQLGVSKTFVDASSPVMNALYPGDDMKNYQVKLPALLAAGIDVLIYAGDVGFICNWLGVKAWTLEMEWPGRDAYDRCLDAPYEVKGKPVGRIRAHEGLRFLQVYQAGHLVPMDQPEVALHMLNEFISKKMVRSTSR